jgi:hypothetical protein
MTPILPDEGTQEYRVLQRLLEAEGNWLHGDNVFLGEMRLRQWHRAIFNLQNRFHWNVEASPFTDEFKFKSYRLVQKTTTLALL